MTRELGNVMASGRPAWIAGLYRGLRVALFSYLGVALVLMWLENRFVYHPVGAGIHWEAPPNGGIQDLDLATADGTRIHAWWLPHDRDDGALLYLHGNAGNLSHRGNSLVKLRDILGVSTLILDYPGYGKSEGSPSEQGCYQTAEAGYRWLIGQGVSEKKILLFGASLGGGVAVELASRKPCRALVLVKTFTNLPDVGRRVMPFLPVRWLMRNRFDSLSRIAHCGCPTFFAHGDADEIIPYPLGKRLYEAAPEPRFFFDLPGQGHNDALPREFFLALKKFLDDHG